MSCIAPVSLFWKLKTATLFYLNIRRIAGVANSGQQPILYFRTYILRTAWGMEFCIINAIASLIYLKFSGLSTYHSVCPQLEQTNGCNSLLSFVVKFLTGNFTAENFPITLVAIHFVKRVSHLIHFLSINFILPLWRRSPDLGKSVTYYSFFMST